MILKMEPFSGASGDMFLGALVGLTSRADLIAELPKKLGLSVEVEMSEVEKKGIMATKVDFKIPYSHEHRHLTDIVEMIQKSNLNESVKNRSILVFNMLGEAESQVHGVSMEKIHFHEVGAIDSILDIVGFSLLYDELKIDEVFSAPIHTGFGFMECEHGMMPIPGPATEKLLSGLVTQRGKVEAELVTPTGAAILKYLNPIFQDKPLIMKKSHYGAATRDLEIPNVLRVSLCEKVTSNSSVLVLQTNLDTIAPEVLGQHFQTKLLEKGALDFTIHSVLMKKGRPGFMLEVLCEEEKLKELSLFILSELPTLGVRHFAAERTLLEREIRRIKTSLGEIRVKVAKLPSGEEKKSIEYEDCVELSKQHGLSFLEVQKKLIEFLS